MLHELVPCEDEGGGVVVRVQKSDGLLTHNEQKSVKELPDLEEHVQVIDHV